MVSFPYYSHIFRDSHRSGIGIVWEAYHKGVPSLGVPENPIDFKSNLALMIYGKDSALDLGNGNPSC